MTARSHLDEIDHNFLRLETVTQEQIFLVTKQGPKVQNANPGSQRHYDGAGGLHPIIISGTALTDNTRLIDAATISNGFRH